MGGCRQWLVQRSLSPSDTPDEHRVKEVVVPILPVIGVFAIGSTMSDIVLVSYFYCGSFGGLATVFVLCYVMWTRKLPTAMIEIWLLILVSTVVLADWGLVAQMGARLWPMVVLVMDVMLAVSIRREVQMIALGFTTFWLVLSGIEDSFRLGLYDIPYWSQADEEILEDLTKCSDPPCARPVEFAAAELCFALVTLLVDYMATRGFAEGMQLQTARLVASVTIAEQIADNLAHFDLDSAGRSLDAHSDALPGLLHESLARLLANLASYRPYLPQSCFAQSRGDDESEESGGDSAPPCARDGSTRSGSSSHSGGSTPRRVRVPASREAVARTSRIPRSSSVRPIEIPRTSLASPSTRAMSVASSDPSDVGRRRPSRASSVTPENSTTGGERRLVHVGAQIANAATTRRLTVLHTNRIGLLAALPSEQSADIAAWLAVEVAGFAEAVTQQKGFVDLLSADHMWASFGGVRTLPTHRTRAVQCAYALGRAAEDQAAGGGLHGLPLSAAAASDTALCGDFGSAAARRFMVVGRVSAMVHAAERAAADWGASLLADELIREDTETAWDWLLRTMAEYSKGGSDRPVLLWELVGKKQQRGATDEWMYEMESAAVNPWAGYNATARAWYSLRWETAEQCVAKELSTTPDGSAVKRALAAVCECIARRDPPPTGQLSVVGCRALPL
eukprot:TRINITY_DN6571_c1_g1_i2.p1 TRINITY_DN6571_c1_g1~~TRINITY_DN6571_c1_g1_i2.p1  ORF type:complete len:722 (+),score=188.06 TRINITY_DN6571_c1_g1_i2:133-2166(+)